MTRRAKNAVEAIEELITALSEYERYTRGVMIPATRLLGDRALIMSAKYLVYLDRQKMKRISKKSAVQK